MDEYKFDDLENTKVAKNNDKLLDKRQLDYLKKLKSKIESGVNVRIIPKTKQALKELFGLDTDLIKVNPKDMPRIKRNSNPLDEDEDIPLVKPVKNDMLSIKTENALGVSHDDEETKFLNKIISDYLMKNVKLIKPDEEPKEVVVIHKHYHYNIPDLKKDEKPVDEETDDADDEAEDDEEEDEEEDDEELTPVEEVVKSKFSDKILKLLDEKIKEKKLPYQNIRFI